MGRNTQLLNEPNNPNPDPRALEYAERLEPRRGGVRAGVYYVAEYPGLRAFGG